MEQTVFMDSIHVLASFTFQPHTSLDLILQFPIQPTLYVKLVNKSTTTFQDRTLVGRPDAGSEPNDIQLSGVGIETHHSVLRIENGDLFIEPYSNARTCVNGSQVRIPSAAIN